MMVVLDTNILLRLACAAHPMHPTARAAVTSLQSSGAELRTVPQNLFEFWAAATRPLTVNGLGLTTAECQSELANIKTLFPLLPDSTKLLAEWESLVVTYNCQGKVSHDARLVAAMRTHSVNHLLTFNGPDFQRYPGLTILDPTSLSDSASGTQPNP